MRIEELLQFDRIVIQCHDNPDAGAITSGCGVLAYLRAQGKDARLIYSGAGPIQKSNLVLMAETLHIPVEYASELGETPDLLLTVDCQYGEKIQVQQKRPVPVSEFQSLWRSCESPSER